MSFFKKIKKDKTKSAETRKQESLDLLESHGIISLKSLPLLEEVSDTTIRTKEEVVQRALALMLIAVYAEGLNDPDADKNEHREFIQFLIERYNAHDFFSPNERMFLDNKEPSAQESIHYSWQYEPFTVMLWALNLLSTEEALAIPATICDVSKAVKLIQGFDNYDKLLSSTTLRSVEEIVDQNDLIYRYDWVCVDARINRPETRDVSWGIVMERHKALNWLTNYGYDKSQSWDEVTTDT